MKTHARALPARRFAERFSIVVRRFPWRDVVPVTIGARTSVQGWRRRRAPVPCARPPIRRTRSHALAQSAEESTTQLGERQARLPAPGRQGWSSHRNAPGGRIREAGRARVQPARDPRATSPAESRPASEIPRPLATTLPKKEAAWRRGPWLAEDGSMTWRAPSSPLDKATSPRSAPENRETPRTKSPKGEEARAMTVLDGM